MSNTRIKNEQCHGAKLAKGDPSLIWNWAGTAGGKRFDRRVKLLSADLTSSMKVLELGCGTGLFTKAFSKCGASITAIDISEDLLKIASSTVKEHNVRFQVENAFDMRFPNDSFDAVIGSSVLHHLDIDKALPECYRVLKSGGLCRFTEPNMLNPQILLQKNIPIIKRMAGDSPDETAFFRWSLRRKMSESGFREISIAPFDFLHPSTPSFLTSITERCGMFLESVPLFREIAGSLYIQARK